LGLPARKALKEPTVSWLSAKRARYETVGFFIVMSQQPQKEQ
jgi:hypothetical protein